jgi:hypothetical protein
MIGGRAFRTIGSQKVDHVVKVKVRKLPPHAGVLIDFELLTVDSQALFTLKVDGRKLWSSKDGSDSMHVTRICGKRAVDEGVIGHRLRLYHAKRTIRLEFSVDSEDDVVPSGWGVTKLKMAALRDVPEMDFKEDGTISYSFGLGFADPDLIECFAGDSLFRKCPIAYLDDGAVVGYGGDEGKLTFKGERSGFTLKMPHLPKHKFMKIEFFLASDPSKEAVKLTGQIWDTIETPVDGKDFTSVMFHKPEVWTEGRLTGDKCITHSADSIKVVMEQTSPSDASWGLRGIRISFFDDVRCTPKSTDAPTTEPESAPTEPESAPTTEDNSV